MGLKTKKFEAFGVQYRTSQFAAVRALELLAMAGDIDPTELLATTEAESGGKWHPLDSRYLINGLVVDSIGVLPPVTVLGAIMGVVNDINFGFLKTWNGVKVPLRFIDDVKSVSSKHVDPLVSQLTQDGAATLRELEEYYSLEDAFKMFDVSMVKGINSALSNEAAAAANKAR